MRNGGLVDRVGTRTMHAHINNQHTAALAHSKYCQYIMPVYPGRIHLAPVDASAVFDCVKVYVGGGATTMDEANSSCYHGLCERPSCLLMLLLVSLTHLFSFDRILSV